jgi:hypothetical protein
MSNRFDHLAKQIGREALGPSGPTIAHDEINAETQYADLRHEPTPGRQADRDRAGLLGRLASSFCLIEVYSEAPGEEDFRACLSKHLTSWRGRTRKTENDNRKLSQQGLPPEPFVDPFLWIIAAGEPTTVLTELELKPEPYWPAGVYLFGADILRVGIVVASELPRDDPSTLLVRLMAAGPLLAHAVKELAALPPDAYERVVAEPILLNLQSVLGQKSSRDPDEQEFIMVMQRSWEDARAEGRTEGRTEACADDVLTVLRARGIIVSDAARERILTQKDLQQMKSWLEKASVATSIGEVIDDRS